MSDEPDQTAETAETETARQLERGALFTHSTLSAHAARLNELAAFVYGALDVLISRGVVDAAEIEAAAKKVRDELVERNEAAHAGVALRRDAPAPIAASVDCEARMHVCRSICCKLDFALSPAEVERGTVKWDLGRPYAIRHDVEGRCVHRCGASGRCTVYDARPTICRTYSCANDERIWKDFEAMELNHEWIDAHLGGTRARLLLSSMMAGPGPAAPTE